MKPEEFAHYVDSQLKQGIPRGALVNNLLAGGWTQEQIDRAFAGHDQRIHKVLSSPDRRRYILRDLLWWSMFLIVALASFLFYMGDPTVSLNF